MLRLVPGRFRRAILIPLLALAGCGGPAPSRDAWVDPYPLPADTMTVAAPELGVHGGRFVIAATSSPKTFNPVMGSESSTNDVTSRLFVGLADWDYRTHQDYGVLAKSWERSPDGLTYTFHLRRGAAFSDGHALTSDDVLFTAAVTLDSTVGASLRASLQSAGRPFVFEAPDSYTVVVRLAGPHRLAIAAIGSLRVLPKHRLEAAWKEGRFPSSYGTDTPPESLVTSGPWILRSYLPQERTVLARNPYWLGVDARGNRLPYLDEVVLVVVPDQAAAALKFQSGEVDGLDNVKNEDYSTYEQGQEKGDYHLYDLGPGLNTSFLWFNLRLAEESAPGRKAGSPYAGEVPYSWFSRVDFRRAVSHAIDRDAIIRGPYFGDAVKNWAHITPGNPVWSLTDVVHYDYDPERARTLLAGLGWKDTDGDGLLEDEHGRTIRFTIKTNGDNKTRMDVLTMIHDDLRKVGVDAVPAGSDFNTLTTNFRTDFQYEAALLGLGSAVPPDPGIGMNFWRSSGVIHYWAPKQKRPMNAIEARLDSLADAHIAALDDATARETYRALQTTVNENAFVIYLPSQVVRIPVRNGFGNLSPNVVPHRLLWNIDQVFVKPGGRRRS